jgi:hypothetical protein
MGKHLAWWPMEASNAWWPLKGSKLGGLVKEKEKHPFHLFSLLLPNKIYLNLIFH